MLVDFLTLSHAAATWFMVGIIWFVQIAHYPLFGRVGPEAFPEYGARNMRLTAWVVGLPMGIEGLMAVLLLAAPPVDAMWLWAGLGLLALIWLSTAIVLYPLHRRLIAGFDVESHARLLTSNWIRTIAWTLRGLLALYLMAES